MNILAGKAKRKAICPFLWSTSLGREHNTISSDSTQSHYTPLRLENFSQACTAACSYKFHPESQLETHPLYESPPSACEFYGNGVTEKTMTTLSFASQWYVVPQREDRAPDDEYIIHIDEEALPTRLQQF